MSLGGFILRNALRNKRRSFLTTASVAVCPAAGTCSASLAGRCSAAGMDGAACSTADTGTHCMAPAKCVASKCTLPNPATCR